MKMKNSAQIKERWDIVEMLGYGGHWRSLLVEYDSMEEAIAEVRKLNKKAMSQTAFFVRDIINEPQNLSELKRG
jgi:hypothetical protein